MANTGKTIKALRIRKNMTQDELAEKLFVSRQTVSNYSSSISMASINELGLAVGGTAYAVIKASSVMIGIDD